MIQSFLRGLQSPKSSQKWSVKRSLVCALLVCSASLGVTNSYDGDRALREVPQVLESYSFDFSEHQLPLAYTTHAAAVQVHHKYKLIPEVPARFGAVQLSKRINADRKFAVDVEFTLRSDPDKSHGFVIMLSAEPAAFPEDFHPATGIRPDYKGLGIFIYRSETKGRWFIVSLQNNGLVSIVRTRDLDSLISQKNSCDFEMMSGARSGVRVKILYDYIYIEKKEDGGGQYTRCVTAQIRDPYFHYLAVVAGNKEAEDRTSDIDLDAIKVTNLDPAVYTDQKALDVEKLELSAAQQKIQKQSTGDYHPADLVAHKMQQHLEQENRRALTFLDEDDDKLEYIFKHYKTIQSHQHGYEEMIAKSKEYKKQEAYEASFTLAAAEQTKLQTKLEEIKRRAQAFADKYQEVRKSVTDAILAQLHEYMESVDTAPKIGVNAKLKPLMEDMHGKVDTLIRTVDTTMDNAKKFNDEYLDELKNKTSFYKTQDAEAGKRERRENRKKPETIEIPQETLDDITFGVDEMRTAFKEKYLGRAKGAARGDTALAYSPTMLTLAMSGVMLLVLAYIHKQVSQQVKNKIF